MMFGLQLFTLVSIAWWRVTRTLKQNVPRMFGASEYVPIKVSITNVHLHTSVIIVRNAKENCSRVELDC